MDSDDDLYLTDEDKIDHPSINKVDEDDVVKPPITDENKSAQLSTLFNAEFRDESPEVYRFRLQLHQDLEELMQNIHLKSSRHELCSRHLHPLESVYLTSLSLSRHTLERIDDMVARLIRQHHRENAPPQLAPDVSYLMWRYKLAFVCQVAVGFGAGVWGTKDSLRHSMGADCSVTSFSSKYEEMQADVSFWKVSVRHEALVDFWGLEIVAKLANEDSQCTVMQYDADEADPSSSAMRVDETEMFPFRYMCMKSAEDCAEAIQNRIHVYEATGAPKNPVEWVEHHLGKKMKDDTFHRFPATKEYAQVLMACRRPFAHELAGAVAKLKRTHEENVSTWSTDDGLAAMLESLQGFVLDTRRAMASHEEILKLTMKNNLNEFDASPLPEKGWKSSNSSPQVNVSGDAIILVRSSNSALYFCKTIEEIYDNCHLIFDEDNVQKVSRECIELCLSRRRRTHFGASFSYIPPLASLSTVASSVSASSSASSSVPSSSSTVVDSLSSLSSSSLYSSDASINAGTTNQHEKELLHKDSVNAIGDADVTVDDNGKGSNCGLASASLPGPAATLRTPSSPQKQTSTVPPTSSQDVTSVLQASAKVPRALEHQDIGDARRYNVPLTSTMMHYPVSFFPMHYLMPPTQSPMQFPMPTSSLMHVPIPFPMHSPKPHGLMPPVPTAMPPASMPPVAMPPVASPPYMSAPPSVPMGAAPPRHI